MINKTEKILIVDDDQDVLELLRHTLAKEGFEVSVAGNGAQAIEQAKKIIPAIIVMDVMMPVMDGIEACRQLKSIESTQNIPIIFLTARSEEFAEIAGFEAGADDYISKPVRGRILLSRVKAHLRKNNNYPKIEHEKLDFGILIIDREQFNIVYHGISIQFPKKEFELLLFLASRPGRVFTRDEILENVWGTEVVVVDRTIDVHVRKIREKLDDKFIRTIKGVGYKFEI